jgi:hypothetical protein
MAPRSGAAGLVRRHSQGSNPQPSRYESKRRSLIERPRPFGIHTVDRLIFARSGCRSMRAMGYP